MEICAVVMAAGKSTRMKSKISKVAHQVSGKPIIQWVADALFEAGCSEQVYVVGEQQEQIRSILGENVIYVLQEEQRGTGHAVMQASGFLEGRLGVTIVLPGDCPMVSADTIKRALAAYEAEGDDCAAMIGRRLIRLVLLPTFGAQRRKFANQMSLEPVLMTSSCHD